MRIALLAVLFAGCVQQSTSYPPPGGGGGYYPPPGSGDPPPTSYGCTSDTQCGSELCARDGECLPANDIYAIHVSWTLQGQAASTTTCANSSSLEIQFTGTNAAWWGYAPVPCVEGKFSIDKMPTWYTDVDLMRDGETSGGAAGTIDAQTGILALDLPY
jgi:hypothetical protein